MKTAKRVNHQTQPKRLLELARKALRHSYAPYSKFHVGAAVLASSGKVYAGANVENASYGLCICAERAAIFQAVNDGQSEILAVAIATDTPAIKNPCGACLQVIAEFASDQTMVYVTGASGLPLGRSWREFLPLAFKFSKK
ncbi:MAG: cytidine deaminase [Elusimicrobia bacterium]|nr:cytidine deaminase [Elusimicrobiota bacterium]